MILKKLTLSNFKGAKSQTFEFAGKDAKITGANGAGKTTCADAELWLLTGKDSMGQADFEIKGLALDGSVAAHGIEHSVEGVFVEGDREVTLRRVWKEKWTNRRGSADKVYDGDESAFYVDGIKRDKREYEEAVASLLGEK